MDVPAKDYFQSVRRASERIEECQRIISELQEELPPNHARGGGRSSTTSDPTYSAMVERDRMLTDAVLDRDKCLELVGEALAIIEGLRRIFSRKADVLELYYIDCLSWQDVADGIGIGKTTAHTWNRELLAWVDDNPRAYITSCRFVD